jgi:autotransporter-associated beta strand protein
MHDTYFGAGGGKFLLVKDGTGTMTLTGSHIIHTGATTAVQTGTENPRAAGPPTNSSFGSEQIARSRWSLIVVKKFTCLRD